MVFHSISNGNIPRIKNLRIHFDTDTCGCIWAWTHTRTFIYIASFYKSVFLLWLAYLLKYSCRIFNLFDVFALNSSFQCHFLFLLLDNLYFYILFEIPIRLNDMNSSLRKITFILNRKWEIRSERRRKFCVSEWT